MTKTTADGATTYYQDPSDHELWYTDPADIGWQGVATATFELPEVRARRRQLIGDQAQAERDGDTDWAEGLAEELAETDAEIALLRWLAE